MTGQEALTLIDRLLQTAKQQGLNDLQSKILLAVWEGHSYQVVADRLSYEVDYIKQIAARLWKQIAQVVGEDVSRSNIQSVLRRYQQTHEVPVYNKMQDWGDAIDVDHFYDRQTDLQTLEAWTLNNSCRLIGIFGLGGIGKTALSVKLAQMLQDRFECLIWRSLGQAPPLKELLEDIVPRLTNLEVDEVSTTTLLEQLRQKHCLLVLDNVESILQGGGDRSGEYQAGYEDYCQLFEYICDEPHRSCLILTGREKPGGIAVREGTELPVRSLQLQGLSVVPAQKILVDKGLIATTGQYQALVNYFGGNPLALKIAATTIQTLSGDDIQAFLAQGSTVFSSLWDLLEQQFQRLSTLQQQVMYWFAINREGVTPVKLQAKLLPKLPLQKLLEILEALHERSLIETTETGLSQQPVIMEYVTEHFIQNIEREIIEGKLNLFRTHALIEAQTQDYLREAQIQMILHPLTERLLAHFGSKSQLEQHLCNILADLRQATPAQTGYAGGNLLNLFCYLKTDLKGFDFSHLFIRQAYLLNAVLHDTDFTDAQISQTVFAETFGGVVSVAFSHDGQRLATSDTRGDIQIWDAQTRTQLVRFRGHQNWTWAVAFSPDGKYLASVSDDCRVKLWEVETGQYLQTYKGHTNSVNAVAFSPNGQILASCGQDATIRLWQVASKTLNSEIQTLMGHSERIWAIAFSPDGQILASGGEDCSIRLWDLATGICYAVWQPHERWVRSLAFSPDGRYLASSSYDQTIKLWNIQTQDCIRTLRGHRQPVTAIAFSPNGQYLASSYDHTIKLWDVATGECLKTFEGHLSPVVSVAFSPCGKRLASSEFNGTIRLWDTERGECCQTYIGHNERTWSVTFSPDGERLLSASFDQTLKLWDVKTGECLQTFIGHQGSVANACFSPDSQFIISGGFDRSLKLWQTFTGKCDRTLNGHTHLILALLLASVQFNDAAHATLTAFSGGLDESIKVWDLASQICVSTWRVPRPYEGMKIKGLQGLSEAQLMTLIALGAVE